MGQFNVMDAGKTDVWIDPDNFKEYNNLRVIYHRSVKSKS